MSRKPLILLFIIIWTAISISATLWGFKYNWPDFVHVNYGLPLTWATNTLSTFVGPANIWVVSITYLMLDLLFWLGLMTVVVAIMLYKFKLSGKNATESGYESSQPDKTTVLSILNDATSPK